MDFNPDVLQSKLQLDFQNRNSNDLTSFRCSVLEQTILKKYVPKDREGTLESEAIEGFLVRNAAMQNGWSCPDDLASVFATWRDILHRVFNSGEYQTCVLTLDKCVEHGYTGPGASVSTKHTDFVGKMFDSTLSFTDTKIFKHYCSRLSPRWQKAELLRSSNHSEEVVSGNNLSTVPKDANRNRTICTEPSLNMFYQLGAKAVIEGLLSRFYQIDMATQPDVNKLMARSGSIHGAYATIDLKNASDSMHVDLIKYLLPKEAADILFLLRSPSTKVHGKRYDLNMISTMGNGFTFPLMTLLFCTLFDALCVHTRRRAYSGVNFTVFGDDIIIPTLMYDEFVILVEAAGFVINHDKSFATGFFRESCGGDYLNGHDVRGVYIKEVNNESAIYSICNRLARWSARHGIDLTGTLQYLKGLVKFQPVPIHASDSEGFKIPFWLVSNDVQRRNGRIMYRSTVAVPRERRITDAYVNPHGALIGALQGCVRKHKVSVRVQNVRYRVERRMTLNWDSGFTSEFRDGAVISTIPLNLISLEDLGIVWLPVLTGS